MSVPLASSLLSEVHHVPIVKNATLLRTQRFLVILACGIPWVMLLVWTSSFITDEFWMNVVLWASLVVTALVTVMLQARLNRNFVCPDCAGPVSAQLPTEGWGGELLLRHCLRCDVLWKVGQESD